jgi:hypothetical membrane protein
MRSETYATKSLRYMRIAGFLGAAGSIVSLMMVLAAAFFSSWFSWAENALSELGVGKQAVLFNSAVLVGGASNLVFASGLRLCLKNVKSTKVGVYLIMVGSVSLALVGVLTVESFVLHALAAFGYFILFPAGLLFVGFDVEERVLKRLSFACGVAALSAILVLPVAVMLLRLKIGFAVPELAESLAVLSWTMPVSVRLMTRHS